MATQPKGIKVQLTIADRYNIQSLLPPKASLLDQIKTTSIIKKIEFSSSEIDEYKMVEDHNGTPQWDKELAKDKSVEFTTGEIELLHTGVNLKDTAKEIKPFMVDICLKVKEWTGSPIKM